MNDLNQPTVQEQATENSALHLIWRRFLLLFFPSVVICITSVLYIFNSEIELDLARVHYTEASGIQVGALGLGDELKLATSDLAYFAAQKRFIQLISNHKSTDINDIQSDWLVFSRTRKVYDQIRWIDANGLERIRINFNHGKPLNVSKDKLQNKANRYYFTDTVKLNKGEFFISPFDLNIENGIIEQPIKPTIRIATPVFDQNGNNQGIILLNYLGANLLDQFRRHMDASHADIWLVNREGYWLKGPSRELEWGFMYQRPEQSMDHYYPEVWKQILAEEKGQFESEHNLWTFTTIFPVLEGHKTNIGSAQENKPSRSTIKSKEYFWKVVFLLPEQKYLSSTRITNNKMLLVLVVLFIALPIWCWRLAATWAKHQLAKKEILRVNEGLEKAVKERTKDLSVARDKAEILANTDALTGMNNRRSFFELGQIIHGQSDRYDHQHSVIMLDLDWFKKINDTYGHQLGDTALVEVGKIISSMTRGSDIAGRIGGEEFAIIMPETPLENGKDLAERLRLAISEIRIELINEDNEVEELKFTASLGITQKNIDDDSIADTLKRADKALYQAKKSGRNKVFIF